MLANRRVGGRECALAACGRSGREAELENADVSVKDGCIDVEATTTVGTR